MTDHNEAIARTKDLPNDIYKLFLKENHKVNPDNLSNMLSDISNAVYEYLEGEKDFIREPKVRLSMIGTKDRKLWYEFNAHDWLKERTPETPHPKSYGPKFLRFFAGTLWEAILIFLAKEAGHDVTRQQEEVFVAEVPGHLDLFLNGMLTDVKTASSYSYPKFLDINALIAEDSFGYLDQLSGYKEGACRDPQKPAFFWAFNKSTCEMHILEVPTELLNDANERVEQVKKIISLTEPPKEKCWPAKEHGSAGNLVLHKNCSWCEFKELCWKDANDGKGLRTFAYAKPQGWVDFVKVIKEPTVEEVKKRK